MSDESDIPENPPASLIPRSAGGTPPPQRRAASRAPQQAGGPLSSVPPTPWGSSAPNAAPKRASSPAHTPTPAPPSKPPTPVYGSAPATGAAASVPPITSPAPPPGLATTRSKAPIPMPSSRPPFDVLMPAPKKPFSLPPYTLTLIKMVFGFTILLLIAYSALVALNPKARKWATQKDGPTPFKSVNQMLAMPAQLVGKTKDVVATNDARVGVLDGVIADGKKSEPALAKPLTDPFGKPAETPGKSGVASQEDEAGRISREALLAMAEKDPQAHVESRPTPVRPNPTEAAAAPGPAELKLGGGVVVTNRAADNAPTASAPFVYWVAGLTVGGVTNSNPARFLMNGRLVREGDEVNRQLAITFTHVDAAAKLIYFRDKNGAVVTRSY